ncbi:MAG: hypothetical protein J6S78_04280 [Lachnospiraceae bacterium]|nr:hypothetical protein [Lachnospiraceae bacterium]
MYRKKKSNGFKIGLLIYVIVLALAILVMDDMLWTKLEWYEVTEERKEAEQKKKIAKAASDRLTPSVTASPTPTPEPIYLETVKIVKPLDATCYVAGKVLEGDDITWTQEEDKETFASLEAVTSIYKEYENALDGIIPVRESVVYTMEKGSEIRFLDADGTSVRATESTTEIEVDGQQRIIRMLTCPYYNEMKDYEELTKAGFDFLTKFCLFCSNDKSPTEMRPYFPDNSQYYRVIASLDNSWFNMHNTPPTYTEQTVRNYIGYNDSLVYMDLTMHQSFVSSWTWERFDSQIEHPIWFVKMNGKWKVASIIFNAQELREK